MGCWGMGITQSDEYCEIYERFMDEYEQGKPIADIKKDILNEYSEEFNEDDSIFHDVYFALGKAEWMCGGISNEVFEKISHIIKSGENIAFYRELGATEKDLKLRKKNLDKFLASISVARGKIKKRKTPVDKYVKIRKQELPDFRCGDVFAYEIQGKYRVLCFVDKGQFFETEALYCYAFFKLFEELPVIDDLVNEYIIPLGYFTVETFPHIEKLNFIGNNPEFKKLDITHPHIISEKWKPATFAIAKEENLLEDYPIDLCMKFSDCIKKIDIIKGANNEYI
ncbi:MAG: hypothetical protein IJ275_00365 [Ruminococcus sp.]|nr:hypothetical protein [Ruminococcus sp.]